MPTDTTAAPCPFCGEAACTDMPVMDQHRSVLVGCPSCDIWFSDHDADSALAQWNRRTSLLPMATLEDERTQVVYRLLCSDEAPLNQEDHWEGWVARRIVAALIPWNAENAG